MHGPTHPKGGCLDQRRPTTHVIARVVDIAGISYESAQAVQTWLHEQPTSFFFKRMKKLNERYQKCIIVQGDNVEK
jgi:hypothetical protein